MVVGGVFETKGGTSCVILKYTNSKDIDVEFLDGNYFRAKVSARNLRKGEVKNLYNRNIYGVGYIGLGDYRARYEGVKTRSIQFGKTSCKGATLRNSSKITLLIKGVRFTQNGITSRTLLNGTLHKSFVERVIIWTKIY